MKISIFVEEEKELYNPFDRTGATLSGDTVAYLSEKAALAGRKDEIEVEVVSESPVDEDKFRAAYAVYGAEQLALIKKESKLNLLKQIWMFAVGVVFLSLSLALSVRYEGLVFQIISTIGSFALWEAAGSWLIDRRALIARRLRAERLKNSNLIFSAKTEKEG